MGRSKAELSDTYLDCAYIEEMGYQWDAAKARSNLIDFADAVGVFEDEWAFTCQEEEIAEEFRFATLGMDFLGRIVVVVSTYRGDDIRPTSHAA